MARGGMRNEGRASVLRCRGTGRPEALKQDLKGWVPPHRSRAPAGVSGDGKRGGQALEVARAGIIVE